MQVTTFLGAGEGEASIPSIQWKQSLKGLSVITWGEGALQNLGQGVRTEGLSTKCTGLSTLTARSPP